MLESEQEIAQILHLFCIGLKIEQNTPLKLRYKSQIGFLFRDCLLTFQIHFSPIVL